MQSLPPDKMHSQLLAQVLIDRDLSKAGDLFSIDDQDIERDVDRAVHILRDIVNGPNYIRSINDQSVVEICITRLTTAIRVTNSIDRHAVSLAILLESCLGHDLSCTSKDRDPPHAKIVADILSCIFMSHVNWTVIERILPTAIWLLTKGNKELCKSLTSYLCLTVADHAQLLAAYLPLILNSILVHRNHLLIRLLPQVYLENCEPIHSSLRDLLCRLSDCEILEKNSILQLCRLIAAHKPYVLKPYISQLSLHLVSSSTSSAILAIFADISFAAPDVLIRHIPRIRQTAASQPSSVCIVAAILGNVARKFQSNSKDCVSDLVSLFSVSADSHAHIVLLHELYNTADIHPSDVGAFINDVNQIASDSNCAMVRHLAQKLVDKLSTHKSAIRQGVSGSHEPVTVLDDIQKSSVPTDSVTSGSQTVNVDSDAVDFSDSFGSRLSCPSGVHTHSYVELCDFGTSWKNGIEITSPGTTQLQSFCRTSDNHTLPRLGKIRELNRLQGEAQSQKLSFDYPFRRVLDQNVYNRDDQLHGRKRNSLCHNPPDIYSHHSGLYPSIRRDHNSHFQTQLSCPLPRVSVDNIQPGKTGVDCDFSNKRTAPNSELARYQSPYLSYTDGEHAGRIYQPHHFIRDTNQPHALLMNNNYTFDNIYRPTSQRTVFPFVPACRVASTCNALPDAVQQFGEKHRDKIKEYVTDTALRLPLPVTARLHEFGSRTSCIIEFSCHAGGEHCLYDKNRFSVTTKYMHTWIHLLFLIAQAEESNASVSNLKTIWDSLTPNSNCSFVQLVTSSFPSQKALMAVKRELANAQYFNMFELDSMSSSQSICSHWVCFICHRPELAASLLQTDGLPSLEGHLQKKRGRFRMLQPWKLRQFKLSGMTITYNKNGLQQRTVSSIQEIRMSRSRIGGDNSRTFKIFTAEGETLALRSHDVADAERWILCLRVIIARSHYSDISIMRTESINMGLV